MTQNFTSGINHCNPIAIQHGAFQFGDRTGENPWMKPLNREIFAFFENNAAFYHAAKYEKTRAVFKLFGRLNASLTNEPKALTIRINDTVERRRGEL